MDKFVREYWPAISSLLKDPVNNRAFRERILRAEPDATIDGISQAARNLLRNGEINIRNGTERTYLTVHKTVIEQLANRQISTDQKRQLLAEKGLRFLRRILVPIVRHIRA